MRVGPADGKAFVQKNLGQAAHADAADSDKMNPAGLIKINMIHRFPPV